MLHIFESGNTEGLGFNFTCYKITQARIDSSGRLLLGTVAQLVVPLNLLHAYAKLQVVNGLSGEQMMANTSVLVRL